MRPEMLLLPAPTYRDTEERPIPAKRVAADHYQCLRALFLTHLKFQTDKDLITLCTESRLRLFRGRTLGLRVGEPPKAYFQIGIAYPPDECA